MTHDISQAISNAILAKISDAQIEVSPQSPGHFSLNVKSSLFKGKTMVAAHRIVYQAIAHLMDGDDAPVHAIDRLETEA